MCADYCTTKVVCAANPKFREPIAEDDGTKGGYFRDQSKDDELFWLFGFSWREYIAPFLDEEGEISSWSIQRLLEMLRTRERIFEFNLAEFPAQEQQRLRQRYVLVKKFFTQAVEENASVGIRF